MTGTPLPEDHEFMQLALAQARKSYEEGGIPVGAVMVENGAVIAEGHNRRVQMENPILHGEMDCLQSHGRRTNYHGVTLYTTLNPCMMCAGTAVQFGIARVVIGQEKVTFPPEHPFLGNIDFLRERGIEVVLLHDPDCQALFDEFLANPKTRKLWLEDIGIDEDAYRKLMTDSSINHFFDDIDARMLQAIQKDFLVMAMDGPNGYTGKDVRAAHAFLLDRGLTDLHIDRVVQHLKSTLEQLRVPNAVAAQILATAGSLRTDIAAPQAC